MARALIVVDVQNDFCEGGALGVKGGIAVASNIHTLLTHEHGYDVVVATRDHHIDPGSHFSENPDYVDSWPPHCVVGTDGVEFQEELHGIKFDGIFDKGEDSAAYSGFEGRDHAQDDVSLADFLRGRGVEAVDVVGIATDYCVRATALDANEAGFDTSVLVRLTAAVHPANTEDVVAELEEAGVWVAT